MESLKNIVTGQFCIKKYWRLREKYINSKNGISKLYYYIRVKRIENKNNGETGISYHDSSAIFEGCPHFPHGLNGIIISRRSKIGKNVTILQQVTIGTKVTSKMTDEELHAPFIGDNCYIGAGAKIIGDVKIGRNTLIGANAVVMSDVPDNHVAVGIPARIIPSKNDYMLHKGDKNES